MPFLTLTKVPPCRATDQPSTLKTISSVAPPSCIKIHVCFQLGRYDEAILLEALDLGTAKDFHFATTTQTYTTETLSALPTEEL